MYNHATKDYICPICLGIKRIENDNTLIRPTDIVYQDELVTAFISSFFIGNNSGHVIIVPNEHFENIYDLPINFATQIYKIAHQISIALKTAYKCEGITTLQNNEPAGNQHAFHYHFHVFPRYINDDLHTHMLNKQSTTPKQRQKYAEKIKNTLRHKA